MQNYLLFKLFKNFLSVTIFLFLQLVFKIHVRCIFYSNDVPSHETVGELFHEGCSQENPKRSKFLIDMKYSVYSMKSMGGRGMKSMGGRGRRRQCYNIHICHWFIFFFQNILRVFTVFMTGCIVLIIPNFANLMALVGATCCTMLAFTLPGLFHMCIFKGQVEYK